MRFHQRRKFSPRNGAMQLELRADRLPWAQSVSTPPLSEAGRLQDVKQ